MPLWPGYVLDTLLASATHGSGYPFRHMYRVALMELCLDGVRGRAGF
jgi:hypothetical protein